MRSARRYLTHRPTLTNGGPLPSNRHLCKVRGETHSIKAASLSRNSSRVPSVPFIGGARSCRRGNAGDNAGLGGPMMALKHRVRSHFCSLVLSCPATIRPFRRHVKPVVRKPPPSYYILLIAYESEYLIFVWHLAVREPLKRYPE
jgi:hypothetical protein